MKREELKLESWRFTSTSALAREIVALLENSDYKLIVHVSQEQIEQLYNELESCKTLGRVRVEVR